MRRTYRKSTISLSKLGRGASTAGLMRRGAYAEGGLYAGIYGNFENSY